MNDELLDKVVNASKQSCDMVCDLRDLKSCNDKECIYDECCWQAGCLKCMAEVVEWLKSEGVI